VIDRPRGYAAIRDSSSCGHELPLSAEASVEPRRNRGKCAEQLGATFGVERRDGGGTFIFMRLPLDPAMKAGAGEMIAGSPHPA
jgi:hypothetical protein